jgi:hypothetical protein
LFFVQIQIIGKAGLQIIQYLSGIQVNKIFASLQEDGKGGDICSVNDYIYGGLEGVAIYQNYGFRIDRKGKAMGISLSSTDIKIIGIQQ